MGMFFPDSNTHEIVNEVAGRACRGLCPSTSLNKIGKDK